MEVLCHHIYEYKKGLRSLILHTMPAAEREAAEKKLKANHIHYFIRQVGRRNINVFFGEPECMEVMEYLANKPLNKFSPEEDFILGALLGYDKRQQCLRYLAKKRVLKAGMAEEAV